MFSKRSLMLLKNSLKNNESLRVFQYACTRNLAGTAYGKILIYLVLLYIKVVFPH